MKTYTITEQQIEEAHKAACSGWKTRIEGWFPEKYKIKSGWYKCEGHPKYLIYIDIENNKVYGFDIDGKWFEDVYAKHYNDYEPLINENVVEERLIKEAIRRGFVEGAKHNTYERTKDVYECKGFIEMGHDVSRYPDNKNTLHFTKALGLIFKDGEWADVVSKTDESKEYITVDGIKYKRRN